MSEPIFTRLYDESLTNRRVTYCAFSQCGDYFGIVDDQNRVTICRTSLLLGDSKTDASRLWSNRASMVVASLDAGSAGVRVNCVAFGRGDITRCRLPHRLAKRRSLVTKRDRVCVIAVAKSNGYIDVYNVQLLQEHVSSTLAKMVLFDGRQSIEHLAMSAEGSLRLASTSCHGTVKLWDIWDDGNMYATVASPTSAAASSSDVGGTAFYHPHYLITKQSGEKSGLPYNHEVSVTAWHPFEGHLFLGDRKGLGLVLQDEHLFRCLRLLRHHHRISGAVYSRDGDFLLTSSYDGSCAIWSVPAYTIIRFCWHMSVRRNVRLLGGANDFHVTGLALAPDLEAFATFCEDGTLRLWPLARGLGPWEITRLENLDRRALHERSVAFSPCGRLLACSLGDRNLQVWSQEMSESGRPQKPSLMSLCIALIRRHVVSNLFTNGGGDGDALTALFTLPLPAALRCRLCHGLEPGGISLEKPAA